MSKRRFRKTAIAKKIEKITAEIMKDELIDAKRAKFQAELEQIYNLDTCEIESGELIKRLNEINKADQIKQSLYSALFGAMVGCILSIICSKIMLSESMNVLSTIVLTYGLIFLGSVIIVGIEIWYIRNVIQMSDYQRLHLEEYEKKLISAVLEKRIEVGQIPDSTAYNVGNE